MSASSCTLSPPKTIAQVLIMGAILITAALSIIAYGTYRCRTPTFEDPLTQSITGTHPRVTRFLDGWGILHFWLFATLAYHYPQCWKELVVAGLLWEATEMLFKERPFYLAKCDARIEEEKSGWWYGRWEDIVMNSLGMVCGVLLARSGAPAITFPVGFVVIIAVHAVLQKHRQKNEKTNSSSPSENKKP